MKVIMLGMGVIGAAVADLLSAEHEVRRASRSAGELRVDASSLDSIQAFYDAAGEFDALIVAIGTAKLARFWKLAPEDYQNTWNVRVMGQINLVRLGVERINDGGAFVLSSGILNKKPLPGFSAVTTTNGAIDGFVMGAAKDMPRGIRINGVSAAFVRETLELHDVSDLQAHAQISDLEIMSARDTAYAYKAAMESPESGRDFLGRDFGP